LHLSPLDLQFASKIKPDSSLDLKKVTSVGNFCTDSFDSDPLGWYNRRERYVFNGADECESEFVYRIVKETIK